MDRTELIQGAAPFFEADKKLEKIYATVDGQYFVKKGHAIDHAAKLKKGAEVEITRNDLEATGKTKTSKK
ncbi:MAG: hypothetical protein AB7P01_06100 [Bacteroidia bacterium]